MTESSPNAKPRLEGADRAPTAEDPQIGSRRAGSEGAERAPGPPSPRSGQVRTRPPHLIRESGVWVWLWVLGAVVLIAIIIIAAMVLPSKKGAGPVHHTGSAPIHASVT